MATFMSIITALPTIWKFWGELKMIIGKLQKLKNEYDVKKFFEAIDKATQKADEVGDTSGYERIIKKGQ